jgi:hypothetical protein
MDSAIHNIDLKSDSNLIFDLERGSLLLSMERLMLLVD